MSSKSLAAGVLLAAGAGTRYGMPKVLAGEGEWLRSAVSALVCWRLRRCRGGAGRRDRRRVSAGRAVVAADWADGLSASLRAGSRRSTRGGFRGSAYRRHPRHRRRRGASGASRGALVTVGPGPGPLRRPPGHPVVVARRHWPELLERLDADEGARPFLQGRADVVAVDCADLATGADIDRP